MRIGRTVDLNPFELETGYRFCLNYLKDSDVSDYSNMELWASLVVELTFGDGVVIVETINSIYEFVKVID